MSCILESVFISLMCMCVGEDKSGRKGLTALLQIKSMENVNHLSPKLLEILSYNAQYHLVHFRNMIFHEAAPNACRKGKSNSISSCVVAKQTD